jgi:hypothetical protein
MNWTKLPVAATLAATLIASPATACADPVPTTDEVLAIMAELTDPNIPASNKGDIVAPPCPTPIGIARLIAKHRKRRVRAYPVFPVYQLGAVAGNGLCGYRQPNSQRSAADNRGKGKLYFNMRLFAVVVFDDFNFFDWLSVGSVQNHDSGAARRFFALPRVLLEKLSPPVDSDVQELVDDFVGTLSASRVPTTVRVTIASVPTVALAVMTRGNLAS